MSNTEIELYIITIITTFASAALAILMARTLSERVEKRAKKSKEMEKILTDQLNELTTRLNVQSQAIDERDHEILSLKSKLEEKDKKIAELQERIKFAEKVSGRDIDALRSQMDEIRGIANSMMSLVAKLSYQLDKEIAKRGKEKK